MKDTLQKYLETVCITQAWAKNMIAKKKVKVDKINIYSISSVKQKLK